MVWAPRTELGSEDSIQAVYFFERNFETRLLERTDWEKGVPPLEADVVVYTDGSKSEEGTGSGIFSEEMDFNLSIPLGIHTTVYQSEIIAMSESSREMLEAGLRGKRILICSDSMSSWHCPPSSSHLR